MKLVVQGLVKQLLVHILVVVATTQMGASTHNASACPCILMPECPGLTAQPCDRNSRERREQGERRYKD